MKIPQLLLLAALAGCHAGSDPAARAEARLRHEVRNRRRFPAVRAAEALGPFAEFPADSESPQVRIGQYRVRIAAGRREYEEILRRRRSTVPRRSSVTRWKAPPSSQSGFLQRSGGSYGIS